MRVIVVDIVHECLMVMVTRHRMQRLKGLVNDEGEYSMARVQYLEFASTRNFSRI